MSNLLQALSMKFCVVGVVGSNCFCSCSSMTFDVQYVFLQQHFGLKVLRLKVLVVATAMAFPLLLPPCMLHKIGGLCLMSSCASLVM